MKSDNFKFIIAIQARLGSSRLPNKVLIPLWEKMNSIDILFKKLQQHLPNIQSVVLCPNNQKNELLIGHLRSINFEYLTGPEDDVLSRFDILRHNYNFTHLVRINSDCPLINTKLVKYLIDLVLDNPEFDYISTIFHNTFPIGMHVEVFTREALRTANQLCISSSFREHVTPYIYNSDHFKIASVVHKKNMSNYRFTLDYTDDLLLHRYILEKSNRINHSLVELCNLTHEYYGVGKFSKNFKNQSIQINHIKPYKQIETNYDF